MGGGPGRGRPGLGMHGGRPERPGEDLPDNCKLYVAGLSENLDDSTLRSLFEPYGDVLHAAGASLSVSCLSFPYHMAATNCVPSDAVEIRPCSVFGIPASFRSIDRQLFARETNCCLLCSDSRPKHRHVALLRLCPLSGHQQRIECSGRYER